MIKASVIGATGYAGEELVRILMRHPAVEVVSLASKSFAGQKYADIYPNYRNLTDLELVVPDLEQAAEISDVVFLALPHGIAAGFCGGSGSMPTLVAPGRRDDGHGCPAGTGIPTTTQTTPRSRLYSTRWLT